MDEFARIKSLTTNTEIQGLCDRAQSNIKQRVPLIEQRDKAESKVKELEAMVSQLKEQVTKLANDWDEDIARWADAMDNLETDLALHKIVVAILLSKLNRWEAEHNDGTIETTLEAVMTEAKRRMK